MLYVVLGDVEYEKWNTLIAIHGDLAAATASADEAWGDDDYHEHNGYDWSEVRVAVVEMDRRLVYDDYDHLEVCYTRKHPPRPPRGKMDDSDNDGFMDSGALPVETHEPMYVRGDDEVIRTVWPKDEYTSDAKEPDAD